MEEYKEFFDLCKTVKDLFYMEWDKAEYSKSNLEIQKKAIIGYEKEKAFFIDKIKHTISNYTNGKINYPYWYVSLEDGIYQENWGLAGLSEWFLPVYASSSSAKIIGERIYFMHSGSMKLMPQTISKERLMQLIKAFMLLTPNERMDKNYYELYLLDGTRVTIFIEPLVKNGQASMVFRRYLIPQLSFEEQAKRKTIPYAAIPLFKAMVQVGYNVVFMGAVRTAKTTFLSTWQSYEDPRLEGVMVETDPEIPMDKILPTAPILQIIADGDDLKSISKNLLRSDADYFILAEARDGIALDTAVKLAAKGTKRMKITFHSRRAKHFPLEAATEIIKATGGDLHLTMQMVASGFDFIFHFIQLNDKGQKRLKGIYQMDCDENGEILIEEICSYNSISGNWTFRNSLFETHEKYGIESDLKAYNEFRDILEDLSLREYVI